MTISYLNRRSAYGTCEDKKACGDAEAAAREGGDGSVANVGVLPVPMLPISNLGRGYGAGRIGLVYYSAKEKIDGT